MSEIDEFAEYWRRLKALEVVCLASENIPPMGAGFIPEPGCGWNLRIVEHLYSDAKSNWYVTDLGTEMLDDPDVAVFNEGILRIGQIQTGQAQMKQPGGWRPVLALSVFLPLMLLLRVLRFPSRPGSPYSLGQAVLGLGSFIALVGFVYGLVQGSWLMVGISVYWWVGSKLIASEARARGIRA